MEVLSIADASAGDGGMGGGRRSSYSSSPEFEFWMVRNPSLPQPNLLSADELFVDGVILPLHLLHQPGPEPFHPPFERDPELEPEPEINPEAGAPPPATAASGPAAPTSSYSTYATPSTSAHVSSSALPATSGSKRWKDIFKVAAGGKKRAEEKEQPRRERKNNAGGVAELNINIWPFSRSRSAGNSGSRPKGGMASAATGRRVSSAPCSRSNSRGESSKPATAVAPAGGGSSNRRWASSPGRAGLAAGGGIHVGRASPVWQPRRGSRKGHDAAGNGGGGGRKGGWGSGGVRVNLNVNTCIGYGQQLSCRADDMDGLRGGERGGPATGNNGNGGHFINLRAFFSKKVY